MDWLIRRLPLAWRVRYSVGWALRRYGNTSHFRIEAMKRLRHVSDLYLKETRDAVDAELARRGR
jgi:3-methyladenine DNA glycosylase AlkD